MLTGEIMDLFETKIVKSIPPTTENWLRKRYNYSINNDTSNEDKHETNHINNKYKDTNTRKNAHHLSMNASAHFVTLLMLSHMHLVAQV